MSRTGKTLVTLIVILVIIGGIYWWFAAQNAVAPSTPTAANSSAPQLTKGDTNADLNQDLASIDAQMNALSSDTASVNQSLSDQPVTQTQL